MVAGGDANPNCHNIVVILCRRDNFVATKACRAVNAPKFLGFLSAAGTAVWNHSC
jgi:hypothetical protein